MRAKIITDNSSLLLGFRLGGISGTLIKDKDEISKEFKKINREDDLALIIFSKSCYRQIEDEIRDFRENNTRPLIVVLD